MPLLPSFQLNLKHPILPNQATIAKYDGKHPSLTCATTSGKIFVHSPHLASPSQSLSEVRFLSINQQVTALSSGQLETRENTHEALFVGTQANILAFDVDENRDLFYRDVDDGVTAICVGKLGDQETPQAIVGGNCNIQGFNSRGEELFFTVTGDNISSMMLFDINGDSRNELLVGSEDFDLRMFSGAEIFAEVSESNIVTALCPLYTNHFGYALDNGIVGLYEKTKRQWRIKSRNRAVALVGFDLDQDGVPELVSGYANGRLEVRTAQNGELIFKDTLSAPVSAVMRSDYRMTGREELVVCSSSGEVRGYTPPNKEAQGSLLETNTLEETLATLSQKKQQLQFELKNHEEISAAADGSPQKLQATATLDVSSAGSNPSVVLTLRVTPTDCDIGITGVLLFAEHTFTSGSLFIHPKERSSTLSVPLAPPKNMSEDVFIKIFAGPKSDRFAVLELVQRLPKFSMFSPMHLGSKLKEPTGKVVFQVPERINRVWMWIKQNFLIEYKGSENMLDVVFVHLRDNSPLRITMVEDVVTIKTDDMSLAGEIVQDLCEFLKVTSLESTATFPDEMEKLREVLLKVEEYNSTRIRLTAEMADSSNLIKALVIKAEDARLLNEMKLMKQVYGTLYEVNRELVGEYRKRESNHTALLAALKEMNLILQKAANLRVGPPKLRIVTACRDAVRSNNVQAIFKIVKVGK
eukprot:TRINITY_DN6306_c0_g1_i1.p1 TRINITY_DN6306_c0_g1~~TRINITY_DN6306_c0_g1_i1.p1  ORF type:complete len:707 (+),score=207.40 TRINITY_DN6306_c0_g1_i1:35-2122(+)